MPPRFDIRLRRTRQIDAAVRAAIVELCTAAYQTDFSRFFFYLPTDGLHFIAYRDDQIVSHAVVTTRWVQPERLPVLRAAYVEAVATLPVFQRRGYASAVMSELTAHLIEYDIAYLTTDQTAFFEHLGWQCWRGPRVNRSGSEIVPILDQQNIMILRLASTPTLNLDRLLTIEVPGGKTR
jgi:GNAT superfamily N-acetyltransferase